MRRHFSLKLYNCVIKPAFSDKGCACFYCGITAAAQLIAAVVLQLEGHCGDPSCVTVPLGRALNPATLRYDCKSQRAGVSRVVQKETHVL